MWLNGVCCHYINPPVAKWVLINFGGTSMTVTISGIATAVISLLLCIPVLSVFNRYMPQLIGKKKQSVPLQTGPGH